MSRYIKSMFDVLTGLSLPKAVKKVHKHKIISWIILCIDVPAVAVVLCIK